MRRKANSPVAVAVAADTGLDVRALAYVLARTDPQLWAESLLDGETDADAGARREIAATSLDELLATYCDQQSVQKVAA